MCLVLVMPVMPLVPVEPVVHGQPKVRDRSSTSAGALATEPESKGSWGSYAV